MGVRPTPRAGPSLCGFFFYISYRHTPRRLRIVAWDVHGTGQVNVAGDRPPSGTHTRGSAERRGRPRPTSWRGPSSRSCRHGFPWAPRPTPRAVWVLQAGPPEPSGKRSRQLPPRGALSALPRGFPARRLSLSGLAHRLSDCLLCVPEVWAGVDSPPHLRVPHRQAQRCLRRAKRPAVPESDARGLPGPRAEATDSRPALKPGVGLTVTRPRDSETGGAVERGPVQWPPYRPRPGGLRSSLGDAGERRRGGRRGVTQ